MINYIYTHQLEVYQHKYNIDHFKINKTNKHIMTKRYIEIEPPWSTNESERHMMRPTPGQFQPLDLATFVPGRGFQLAMGVPQGRWMVLLRENPNLWMMTRCLGVAPVVETPICWKWGVNISPSARHHVGWIPQLAAWTHPYLWTGSFLLLGLW